MTHEAMFHKGKLVISRLKEKRYTHLIGRRQTPAVYELLTSHIVNST